MLAAEYKEMELEEQNEGQDKSCPLILCFIQPPQNRQHRPAWFIKVSQRCTGSRPILTNSSDVSMQNVWLRVEHIGVMISCDLVLLRADRPHFRCTMVVKVEKRRAFFFFLPAMCKAPCWISHHHSNAIFNMISTKLSLALYI